MCKGRCSIQITVAIEHVTLDYGLNKYMVLPEDDLFT